MSFPPPNRLVPDHRFPSTDGVEIAAYLLGGSGPALLVAHATGFCAAVLGPMVDRLRDTVRVVAFDERGHGASGRPRSGNFDWQRFADDALAVLDGYGLHQVLGFGHSCGGAALLLAEMARPGTFRGLYLYEPVVPPIDGPLPFDPADNPLSAGARRRRTGFASREEALANFTAKAPFDVLAPEVLAAYVDNAFRFAPGGGIELRCARDDEARIYEAGFTHHAYQHLDEIRCPVTVACGELTDALGPDTLSPVVARLPHAELTVLPGLGHFGPLEDPEAVARSIRGSAIWPKSAAQVADRDLPEEATGS